jgi:hypothetical protein
MTWRSHPPQLGQRRLPFPAVLKPLVLGLMSLERFLVLAALVGVGDDPLNETQSGGLIDPGGKLNVGS